MAKRKRDIQLKFRVTPQERHHIVVPVGREPSTATRAFIDWISDRFAAEADLAGDRKGLPDFG